MSIAIKSLMSEYYTLKMPETFKHSKILSIENHHATLTDFNLAICLFFSVESVAYVLLINESTITFSELPK